MKSSINIKVFHNQTSALDMLAKQVVKRIDNKNNIVVLPSGSDANIFYGCLADEINRKSAKIKSSIFVQSEELFPLPAFNAIGFSIQIKKRFSDLLKYKAKILYLTNPSLRDTKDFTTLEKKLSSVSPKIVILAVNTKGEFLGINKNKVVSKTVLNNIQLSKLKWFGYLKRNKFLKKADANVPLRLVSLGSWYILGTKYLYIVATGNHKQQIVDDIMDGKYRTSIGKFVKMRSRLNLKTELYIDKFAKPEL